MGAVVEGDTGDFGVAGKGVLLHGMAVEVDLLAHELVGSVLTGGLDEDGVVAGRYRLPGVVESVPAEGIFAGRTGGRGYRVGDVCSGRLGDAIPAAEVFEVARLLRPEGDGLEVVVVFILYPHGDVGAVVAVGHGRGEFERDEEVELGGWRCRRGGKLFLLRERVAGGL